MYQDALNAAGLGAADILLPAAGTDMQKWAVIACDQYTQDRAYWERVRAFAGDAPSTINLILPEAFLPDAGFDAQKAAIHETMRRYRRAVFAPPRRCCVYVERLCGAGVRQGLVAALDLDAYDWRPGAKTLARATEDTVPDRLPPRMALRRGAALETPHSMVLFDDPADLILPALAKTAKQQMPLYDTDLFEGAGHVSGWPLEGEALELAARAFQDALKNAERGAGAGNAPFLFAVGDGNHSLAAAKAIWEEHKKAHAGEERLAEHPLRWALVELVNLYSPALRFEPIHRVLFNVDMDTVLSVLRAVPGLEARPAGAHCAAVQTTGALAAAALVEPALEALTRERQGIRIDYLHGEEETRRVAEAAAGGGGSAAASAVGVLLPPFAKEGLFASVARGGPLPRKSFSMGAARDKRFSLECRGL
jgi:hypothetical protein